MVNVQNGQNVVHLMSHIQSVSATQNLSLSRGSMDYSEHRTTQTTTSSTSTAMIATMAMPTRPTYMFSPVAKPTVPTPANMHTHAHTPTQRNVTAIIHSPERSALLCRYPSKLCDMVRSEKRGGGLHRFCAYHRERANINQRRVDHRRRLRKKGLPVPPLERAPSHYQHANPRQSDLTPRNSRNEEARDVKKEEEQVDQQQDQLDLFDAIESAQPLLPDFSAMDLQELMHLLDQVDAEPSALSIKEEPGVDEQNNQLV